MNTRSRKRLYAERNICIKCERSTSEFRDEEGACIRCTTLGERCFMCFSLKSEFTNEFGRCLKCKELAQSYRNKLIKIVQLEEKLCNWHLIEKKMTKAQLIEQFAKRTSKFAMNVGFLSCDGDKKILKEIFCRKIIQNSDDNYYNVQDLNKYCTELQTDCELDVAKEKSTFKIDVNSIQYLIFYGVKLTLI